MRFERLLTAAVATACLSGCHIFSKLNPDCHTKQEYQHALSAPPLKVPEGMDSPNTQGALVIPKIELAPPPPGPHDICYDVPPRYQPSPSNKAASG